LRSLLHNFQVTQCRKFVSRIAPRARAGVEYHQQLESGRHYYLLLRHQKQGDVRVLALQTTRYLYTRGTLGPLRCAVPTSVGTDHHLSSFPSCSYCCERGTPQDCIHRSSVVYGICNFNICHQGRDAKTQLPFLLAVVQSPEHTRVLVRFLYHVEIHGKMSGI
jgi:hypothetical protein